MFRVSALLAMMTGIALSSNHGSLAADKPNVGPELAEGTKAFAFRLHKDEKLPEGAVVGSAVDIVGEINDPIKTCIALLNVKLMAVDSQLVGDDRPRAVVVQLTPAQIEVLRVMIKHGTKLGIKLHGK